MTPPSSEVPAFWLKGYLHFLLLELLELMPTGTETVIFYYVSSSTVSNVLTAFVLQACVCARMNEMTPGL